MKIKRITAVIAAVCMVAALSGCDAVDTIKARFTRETETAESAGIVNEQPSEVSNSISVGLLDFDTFNPLVTQSETVRECMEFVYEPLFELNEQQQITPVLAESYTVSPDGKTIDIILKNNIQWQDGTNFNAYDAVYTINQVRSGVTTYADVLANAASCTAADDYTVRITLNYSVPNFVALLTFPIVKNKTSMTVNANYIPIGTGPYTYEKQISAGKLQFSAFFHFHSGRAYIDTLYVYTAPNLQKYESMFEANEIDLMTGKTVDLSEYTPRGNTKTSEYLTNKMTFVGYNLRNPLLAGAQTRHGLTKLIDKDMIVNSIIYSRGTACDVPINPSSVFYYDTAARFKSDELLASEHLGNDNWGVDGKGSYIRHVNGEVQTLSVNILTNSDSEEKVSIAELIADSFNDFGIASQVTAVPYDEYAEKVSTGDYDLMIGEIEISANLDLSPLVSSAGNYFAYKNSALDTLIGQMGMTSDEDQLKELFKQYGEIITEDMPFTPLFFRKNTVLSGSKIKSSVVPSISRMYRNIEKWSVTQ